METLSAVGQPSRRTYLDFLRFISIIAVIIVHITAPRTSMEIGSSRWIVLSVYGNLINWAVPVFVMISGSLFLAPEKDISLQNIFKKNILRMIIAFIFWSALYAVFDTYIYNPTAVHKNALGLVVRFLLGHSHLWFLYMIVGLYLLVPLLRKISADWDMVRYFLVLCLVFKFFIPIVMWALQVVDFVFTPPQSLYDFANQVYSKFNFYFTSGYIFYFVAGYYLARTEISRKFEFSLYFLAILSAVASIVYTVFGSPIAHKDLINLPHIPNLFQPAAIFVFARLHIKESISVSKRSVIRFVADHSFGIFLIHYFVLIIVQWLVFDINNMNVALYVPAMALVVFSITLLICYLLKKISLFNKYLL